MSSQILSNSYRCVTHHRLLRTNRDLDRHAGHHVVSADLPSIGDFIKSLDLWVFDLVWRRPVNALEHLRRMHREWALEDVQYLIDETKKVILKIQQENVREMQKMIRRS